MRLIRTWTNYQVGNIGCKKEMKDRLCRRQHRSKTSRCCARPVADHALASLPFRHFPQNDYANRFYGPTAGLSEGQRRYRLSLRPYRWQDRICCRTDRLKLRLLFVSCSSLLVCLTLKCVSFKALSHIAEMKQNQPEPAGITHFQNSSHIWTGMSFF